MTDIVIVGAGIVGSALAYELSTRIDGKILVLEKGAEDGFDGSTGHAPGYIGIFNEDPILQELARSSVDGYFDLAGNQSPLIQRTGSIEVACSDEQMRKLEQRCDQAMATGIRADLKAAAQARALSPFFIGRDTIVGGVHYPDDCVGDARGISKLFQKLAMENGVEFLFETAVDGFRMDAERLVSVSAGSRGFAADEFVVSGGVWSGRILQGIGMELPIFPVAHPYVYGVEGNGRTGGPFVRWPEKHVYARFHDQIPGFGTYDHAAVEVRSSDLPAKAEIPWDAAKFDGPVNRSIALFSNDTPFAISTKLAGLFSMTPDNLPFLGPVPNISGLWVASAIWVTHALGSAKVLAEEMAGSPEHPAVTQATSPARFDGQDPEELRKRALSLYNDIYGGGEESA